MDSCLMQQVTNLNIADGRPAAAGVEKHGKQCPIALAADSVGWGERQEAFGLPAAKDLVCGRHARLWAL